MAEEVRKIGADAARPELMVQKFSPLSPGTKVDELSILSVLGAGEFGITYIAVQEGSNRRFVLKEYLPRAIAFRDGQTVRVSAANTPVFVWGLDRFLAEGQALAKLKHPAIVGVRQVSERNGTGYMVMTHEDGRDLGVWLHELRRPPTQLELDDLFKPLLEGLGTLHEKELLHLDIAPTNVLVRDNGTPVLIDFGAVRVGMRRRLNLAAPVDAKAFMAPEILTADQTAIGPHSDIYSLAAVLHLTATGTAPLQAEKRMLRDEFMPVKEATVAKLRPAFMAAIDAGLKLRPDDRPQQISGWQEQLMRRGAPQQAAKKLEPPVAENDGGPPAMASKRLYSYPDEGEPAPVPATETLLENPGFRTIFFGAIGGAVGALAGALSSIVIASVVSPSCYTDACVMPILPFTAAAGALSGLYIGAQYGKATVPGTNQPVQIDGEL
jgi:serine/threonine protein kinase